MFDTLSHTSPATQRLDALARVMLDASESYYASGADRAHRCPVLRAADRAASRAYLDAYAVYLANRG